MRFQRSTRRRGHLLLGLCFMLIGVGACATGTADTQAGTDGACPPTRACYAPSDA